MNIFIGVFFNLDFNNTTKLRMFEEKKKVISFFWCVFTTVFYLIEDCRVSDEENKLYSNSVVQAEKSLKLKFDVN